MSSNPLGLSAAPTHHPRRARAGLFAVALLYGAASAAAADPGQGGVAALKSMSIEDLMNVEVTTVSRQESTVGRSPSAVYVITAEDIRRSGATTIPELFRRVPGMNVARIDTNKWAVSARGFNQRFVDKLLVQVDGRTVYNALFSGVYWDAVDYPLIDIERIEIVRGPGASVWGANAVNGVINIITKPAAETQGAAAEVVAGSEDRGIGTFRFGGPLAQDARYRVYGKGTLRDTQFAESGNPHDTWSTMLAGARLDWRGNVKDTFTLQGDVSRSDAERKDLRPSPSPPFSLTNLENEVTHGADVLARWSRQLAPESRWELQTYWNHVARRGSHGYVDVRWDTLDADFHYQFPVGSRNKLVAGAGYRLIDAFLGPSTEDDGFAVSFPPADRRIQLFNGFAQDEIVLVQDLVTATVGSKFEHNAFTGFEWQPTGRILWTPTGRQTVWGAVSRAVRTPNLSEDGIGTRQLPSFPGTPNAPVFPQLRGSPDFEAEVLRAHEIGYRAQPSTAVAFDVAAFYNAYSRLRVVVPGVASPGLVPGTVDLPLTFQNRMTGNTYGIETAVTYRPFGWWRLYGTYAYLNMQLRAGAGIAVTAEIPERQSPRHQTYVQSSWNFPRDVEADVMARTVSRLSGFTPEIDGYASVDTRVAWRPRERLELSLVGQNLLARRHAELGTAALLRSLLVDVERSVLGKVAWRF